MRPNRGLRLIESFPKDMPLADAFECLFENAPDAIYVLDTQGRFVAVNRKTEELTGFKREEYIGESFRKIIPAKSLPKAITGFLSVIKGKSIRLELELKTAAKKTVLVEVTSTPLMSDEKIVGTLGIVRDITERKKAEKVLAKSEERFRTLMEEAPIGICNTGLKGEITYVNRKFEEATGYSREEIVGKNGFKLGIMSDETLKSLGERLKKRLIGKPSRLLEGQFKRKDGEWIWAEVEGRLITKFGVPVGFQLFARDITERKRAEEERKRFEEKLSALNIYSRNLNTAKSMEEIYELTLNAVEKTLGFEFADILIMREKTLCLANHRGYSRISSLELPLDGDKGITVRAARTGKPVFVPNISQEEAYVEGGFGMRSELAVPIKFGKRVLGVLNVESKELNVFDEKDQELLEILASHAATAMSNLEYAKNLEMHAREIRESQERFERLFMDNPEAAVYVDSGFHILDANPRFAKLFGYSLDEIKGRNINGIVVPKDTTDEAEILDRKALKGYVNYDTVRKKKDGTLVQVSISAAPITVENQTIGYVGLYRDITERKMLEERLSALNFYSGKLNTANNLQQVYELTLDAMDKTLGFENATFMVIEKDYIKVACARTRGHPPPLSMRFPLDGTKKGVTTKAAKTCKPVLVPDVKKDKEYVEGVLGIQSELAVPIVAEDMVLGVLNVESNKLDAFNEKDVMLLQILASHAATAISNIGRRQEIEKRSSQFASLMKSSAEMISSTELRQRLEKIAEAIVELGWRRVVLYVTDENLEIRSLENIVAAGITPEEREYLWSTRQPGQVYRERFGPEFERFKIGEFYYLPWSDPFVRKSFSGDTVPSKLSPEEMIDWDPQDLLMAPLRLAEGRFVGMLSIDDPLDGRRPTKESLAPLELFIHQAAVAIENAKLIQQLHEAKKQIKEYADQLELKVEERTKELREAQNRLLKAERLAAIGEVAAIVGHDLRNPLTGIAGATYYLKKKLDSQIDEKTKEMVELIEKDIEHSNTIITDLLDYSREIRLETAETTPKTIMMEALSLVKVPENIHVLDSTQSKPRISVDLERMKRVSVNIIKNAIDAMPEGGKMTIASNEANGSLEITFTDTGTGMSRDVMEKIWTPLFTTKSRGMGLGLSICKRFVEAHGGKISVESTVSKGTTFTVAIPIKPKLEGGEKIWLKPPESLLLTTTKA